MTIGDRIKYLRKTLSLTQQQFADVLDVDQGHIAGIEKGSKNPSKPLQKVICLVFYVNDIWLKTGEGEMFISPEKSIKNQVDHFGELAIVEAITNILAGYGELGVDKTLPIETGPESLSNQAATLKSMLKNLEARFGKRAFQKAIFDIIAIQNHSDVIDVANYTRRLYDKEPELKRMFDILYIIFSAGDERLKSWASVQFDRAFPNDVIEEAQKKQEESEQASAG